MKQSIRISVGAIIDVFYEWITSDPSEIELFGSTQQLLAYFLV